MKKMSQETLDFTELDRLDEENRLNDIYNFLDQLPSDEMDAGDIADLEEVFGEPDSTLVDENVTNNSYRPQDLHRGSSLRRDEAETMRRLITELHEKEVALTTMQLQLNHVRLQIQGLSISEKQMRQDREQMKFSLAASEQDKLLLEARLREVAGFEQETKYVLLEEIRGKLLDISHAKLVEAGTHLHAMKLEQEEQQYKFYEEMKSLDHENQAYRQEIMRLADLLAQRTVLYHAHERRMSDQMMTNQSQLHQMEKEKVEQQTKAAMLQKQVDELSAWKDEHLIQYHTLQVAFQEQQEELEKLQEAYEQSIVDLQGKSSEIHSLQTLIQQLQYLDQKKSYEISYLQELEQVKGQLKQQEEQFRQQITILQDQLQSKTEFSNDQIAENKELQMQLEERSKLLEELRLIGYGNSRVPGTTISSTGQKNESDGREKSASTSAVRSQYIESFLLGNVLEEEKESAMSMSWFKSTPLIDSHHGTATDTWLFDFIVELCNLPEELWVAIMRKMTSAVDLKIDDDVVVSLLDRTKQHLTESQIERVMAISHDQLAYMIKCIGRLLVRACSSFPPNQSITEGIDTLPPRTIISDTSEREIALRSEVKSLKSFLSKVLKRAAEMKLILPQDIPRALVNQPAETNAVNAVDSQALQNEQITRLKDALSILEQERTHYQQQIEVYKQEIMQLEAAVIESREIGKYEVSQYYESEVTRYREQLVHQADSSSQFIQKVTDENIHLKQLIAQLENEKVFTVVKETERNAKEEEQAMLLQIKVLEEKLATAIQENESRRPFMLKSISLDHAEVNYALDESISLLAQNTKYHHHDHQETSMTGSDKSSSSLFSSNTLENGDKVELSYTMQQPPLPEMQQDTECEVSENVEANALKALESSVTIPRSESPTLGNFHPHKNDANDAFLGPTLASLSPGDVITSMNSLPDNLAMSSMNSDAFAEILTATDFTRETDNYDIDNTSGQQSNLKALQMMMKDIEHLQEQCWKISIEKQTLQEQVDFLSNRCNSLSQDLQDYEDLHADYKTIQIQLNDAESHYALEREAYESQLQGMLTKLATIQEAFDNEKESRANANCEHESQLLMNQELQSMKYFDLWSRYKMQQEQHEKIICELSKKNSQALIALEEEILMLREEIGQNILQNHEEKLLRDNCQSQFHALQISYEELEQNYDNRYDEMELALNEAKDLQSQLTSSQMEYMTLQNMYLKSQDDLLPLQEQFAVIEATNKSLIEELRSTTYSLLSLQQTDKELQHAHDSIKEKLTEMNSLQQIYDDLLKNFSTVSDEAKTAEEKYGQLSLKYDDLLSNHQGINDRLSQLCEVDEKCSNLENIVESKTVELLAMTEKHTSLQTSFATLEVECNQLHDKVLQLDVLQEQYGDLTNRCNSTLADIKVCEEKYSIIHEELECSKLEIERLMQISTHYSEDILQYQAKLATQEVQLQDKDQKLSVLDKEYRDTVAQSEQLIAVRNTLQAEKENLLVQSLSNEHGWNEKFHTLQQANEELKDKYSKVLNSYELLEHELSSANERTSVALDSRSSLEEQFTDLHNNYHELQTSYIGCSDANELLSQENATLKESLVALQLSVTQIQEKTKILLAEQRDDFEKVKQTLLEDAKASLVQSQGEHQQLQQMHSKVKNEFVQLEMKESTWKIEQSTLKNIISMRDDYIKELQATIQDRQSELSKQYQQLCYQEEQLQKLHVQYKQLLFLSENSPTPLLKSRDYERHRDIGVQCDTEAASSSRNNVEEYANDYLVTAKFEAFQKEASLMQAKLISSERDVNRLTQAQLQLGEEISESKLLNKLQDKEINSLKLQIKELTESLLEAQNTASVQKIPMVTANQRIQTDDQSLRASTKQVVTNSSQTDQGQNLAEPLFTVMEVKNQLSQLKKKLQMKYQQKLLVAEQAFAQDKKAIQTECSQMISETQQLLSMKHQLQTQQESISDMLQLLANKIQSLSFPVVQPLTGSLLSTGSIPNSPSTPTSHTNQTSEAPRNTTTVLLTKEGTEGRRKGASIVSMIDDDGDDDDLDEFVGPTLLTTISPIRHHHHQQQAYYHSSHPLPPTAHTLVTSHLKSSSSTTTTNTMHTATTATANNSAHPIFHFPVPPPQDPSSIPPRSTPSSSSRAKNARSTSRHRTEASAASLASSHTVSNDGISFPFPSSSSRSQSSSLLGDNLRPHSIGIASREGGERQDTVIQSSSASSLPPPPPVGVSTATTSNSTSTSSSMAVAMGNTPSSSMSSGRNTVTTITGLYPEMLSPEVTKYLVAQIARKSLTEEELAMTMHSFPAHSGHTHVPPNTNIRRPPQQRQAPQQQQQQRIQYAEQAPPSGRYVMTPVTQSINTENIAPPHVHSSYGNSTDAGVSIPYYPTLLHPPTTSHMNPTSHQSSAAAHHQHPPGNRYYQNMTSSSYQ